ncbi:MAG: hypothetical protein EBZ17_11450 [Actinobacteria bacterium]|nr:hypothetical protein [Actinomycetota bacterium]
MARDAIEVGNGPPGHGPPPVGEGQRVLRHRVLNPATKGPPHPPHREGQGRRLPNAHHDTPWRTRRVHERCSVSTVDVAIDIPARLGECPVWSALDQALYWTDIEACVVHRFDPVSGVDNTRHLPGRVGTIALTDQPGVLVLAIENALYEVNWADVGSRRPLHRLEPDGTGNRSNDGRVDPAGRFVLGTMYEDAAAGRTTGSLYRVDQQVTALRTEIGIPNGLAFDAQRGLVYWADTFTARIIVADYDTTDGTWHGLLQEAEWCLGDAGRSGALDGEE